MFAGGAPRDVQLEYFKILYGITDRGSVVSPGTQKDYHNCLFDKKKRVGDGQRASITHARLLDAEGNTPEMLRFGHRYTVEFEGVCHDRIEKLGFGVAITTTTGVVVYAVNSLRVPDCQKHFEKGASFTCRFSFTSRLANNYYFISLDIDDYLNNKPIDYIVDALSIKAETNNIIHFVSLADLEGEMSLTGKDI